MLGVAQYSGLVLLGFMFLISFSTDILAGTLVISRLLPSSDIYERRILREYTILAIHQGSSEVHCVTTTQVNAIDPRPYGCKRARNVGNILLKQ